MLSDTTISLALKTLSSVLPWILAILLLAMVAGLTIFFLIKLANVKVILGQRTILLEVTPPAHSLKSPESTQQLFSIFHGLDASRTFTERLLRRHVTFSLEVVSTRERGIRYMMRVPEQYAPIFEQTLASYILDVRFNHVPEYLPEVMGHAVRALEFKQTGHFAYPLQVHESLQESDPIAYLTGTMTKLAEQEFMAFQIVASPVKVHEASYIANRILANEELLRDLGRRKLPGLVSLFTATNTLLFAALDEVGGAFHSSDLSTKPQHGQNATRQNEIAMKVRPARTLSSFEQELAQSVHNKVRQPLFRTSIRALISVADKRTETQRVTGLRAAMASLGVPDYQALTARYDFPAVLRTRYRTWAFCNRIPAVFHRNSSLLSGAELANIYHFPFATTAKTENVVTSLSRTLPAPISLKGKTEFDIIIGRNNHHGSSTSIGLTTAERERHVYIIGGTGNGKTTLMLYAMVQDINNGKGFAFVDPHGDAAETLLRHVPLERTKDVIYFNPDDLGHPIGLNLLELPPNLTGDELLREKDLVTESTISVFRKIFSDADDGGHRIEYVLRNAIQTALTQEGATLFTVFDLLNDPKYRKQVVEKLQDKDLKNFWQHEIGKAGDFQRVKMAAGITAKIGRFLFSASAKRILEQPKSTIDFDDIINSGKILICNFSKGLLGEDTSELFGITVLAKLQMAALRRARMRQAERRPFYIYVDEFQNFATSSFVQMLSEARKYKLFMLMAEQSTSQQEEQRMVQIILANVGTVISFRSANPADEKMLLPLFSPNIEAGELGNLPSFNFYVRISALRPQEPLSGETLLLEEEGSDETAAQVIEQSRQIYAGKPVASVPTPQAATSPTPTSKESTNKPKTHRRLEKKYRVGK